MTYFDDLPLQPHEQRAIDKETRRSLSTKKGFLASMAQQAILLGKDQHLEKFAAEAKEVDEKLEALGPRKHGSTKFTTKALIKWVRAQGGTIIDQERFDFRTKRHHDAVLRSDVAAMVDGRLCLYQAATKGQRAHHRRDFEALGGFEKLDKLNGRYFYLEFSRGVGEPDLIEEWKDDETTNS